MSRLGRLCLAALLTAVVVGAIGAHMHVEWLRAVALGALATLLLLALISVWILAWQG